jgi:hypothetical protein
MVKKRSRKIAFDRSNGSGYVQVRRGPLLCPHIPLTCFFSVSERYMAYVGVRVRHKNISFLAVPYAESPASRADGSQQDSQRWR